MGGGMGGGEMVVGGQGMVRSRLVGVTAQQQLRGGGGHGEMMRYPSQQQMMLIQQEQQQLQQQLQQQHMQQQQQSQQLRFSSSELDAGSETERNAWYGTEYGQSRGRA